MAIETTHFSREDIYTLFPNDRYGTPLGEGPLMQRVHRYSDMKLVVSFATGIIGEWWANLINAQFGIPVACGCTAVSAPKYYAYLQSGQMIGMLGGLKGASEYERLFSLYRQRGVLIWFHSCGYIAPFVELFLRLGVDVLDRHFEFEIELGSPGWPRKLRRPAKVVAR